jgi:hypothetical protein
MALRHVFLTHRWTSGPAATNSNGFFENTEQRKLRIWRAPSVDGAQIDQMRLQGAPWGSLDALGLWNEPLWLRWRPVEGLQR